MAVIKTHTSDLYNSYLCMQWMSPLPGKQIEIESNYVVKVVPMNNEFFSLCITFANLYNLYYSRIQQILNKLIDNYIATQNISYHYEIILARKVLHEMQEYNKYVIYKYSTYTNEPMDIIESIGAIKEILIYLRHINSVHYVRFYNSVY